MTAKRFSIYFEELMKLLDYQVINVSISVIKSPQHSLKKTATTLSKGDRMC